MWTENDIQILTKLYNKVSVKIISNHLNKSLGSIYVKANQLGLSKTNNWSALGDVSLNHLFKTYKLSARDRNYEFTLTKEQFKFLISSNCHYCKTEPRIYNYYLSSTSKMRLPKRKETIDRADIKASGIDRVDNNLGYNLNNCVPCCKICNIAKQNLSQKEFYNWIEKVYNNI